MTDQLPKIAQARKEIGTKAIWLQVDGGISLETIESAAGAGADTFVAGSAVFNSADPAQMVTILREKAQTAKN
jgi:ribulose-phosphate 3-epimerase